MVLFSDNGICKSEDELSYGILLNERIVLLFLNARRQLTNLFEHIILFIAFINSGIVLNLPYILEAD